MKVLIVGRNYPTMENGMTGIFEFGQAVAIAKRGITVEYLAFDVRSLRKRRKFGVYCECLDNVNVWWCSIPLSPMPQFLRKKIIRCLRPLIYKIIVKRHGMPDIIHVHYPVSFPYKDFMKYQKQGVRIIATEHWTKVLTQELSPQQKSNLSQYVKNANRFICVGETLKQSVIKLAEVENQDSVLVLPNMISNDFYYNGNIEKGKSLPFVYVVAGRLVKHKQVDSILRAFANALEDENIHLWILGDGPEKNTLENLSKELGISKQVKFFGMVSHQKIPYYIHQANALICYSRCETFGVPVAEALCAGKPVIVSNSLGFVEYVSKICGEIVDTYDENKLAKAIKYVYNNYNNYDPIHISQLGIKFFGENSVANRLINIYNESLGCETIK